MIQISKRPVVVITRDEESNARCATALRGLGAKPLSLPMIRVAPPLDATPLIDAVAALGDFRWLLFTSAHAVDATCKLVASPSLWARLAPHVRVAAVGSATAARLAAYHVPVTVVAPHASARDLASAILQAESTPQGCRMLWPRSEIADNDLAHLLVAAGAVVTAPVAYRTIAERPRALPNFLRLLEARAIAAIAFCSPSSARALAAVFPGGQLTSLAERTVIASIGPTTSAALRALGAPVNVESSERRVEALATAIMACLAQSPVLP